MINRVVLVGRLTRDPELRKTQSGTSVCSFTMAVGRRVSTQGQPDADFINCVAWNKTADLMTQYLHKGSLIGLEGRIQTRSYDNQQGQRVYVTEVVAESVQFLEPKNAQSNYSAGSQDYGMSQGLLKIHILLLRRMDIIKIHTQILCRIQTTHLIQHSM